MVCVLKTQKYKITYYILIMSERLFDMSIWVQISIKWEIIEIILISFVYKNI